MASAAINRDTFVPDFEAAGERAREVNDRYLQAGRKMTTAYLDGVEGYITGITKFERKLGEHSQVDAVTTILTTHAKTTDDLTKSSVAAVRELVVD